VKERLGEKDKGAGVFYKKTLAPFSLTGRFDKTNRPATSAL